MKPTVGEIVFYQSRTGKYYNAAVVTATKDNLNDEIVEKGMIIGLTDESHVHLTVFTPGRPGQRSDAVDFVVESPHGRAENVGGLYQEWDIPFDPDGGPGTWRYQ